MLGVIKGSRETLSRIVNSDVRNLPFGMSSQLIAFLKVCRQYFLCLEIKNSEENSTFWGEMEEEIFSP